MYRFGVTVTEFFLPFTPGAYTLASSYFYYLLFVLSFFVVALDMDVTTLEEEACV